MDQAEKDKHKNMIKKIITDKNEIKVGAACDICMSLLVTMAKESNSFLPIRERLNEDEFETVINSLGTTIITTLYVVGAKTEIQKLERISEIAELLSPKDNRTNNINKA